MHYRHAPAVSATGTHATVTAGTGKTARYDPDDMDSECCVCGDPIPDEYEKYDPDAPVHVAGTEQVYHHACEGDMIVETFCAVGDGGPND